MLQIIYDGLMFFLNVIEIVLIIDVILSWVSITGLNVRPRFIGEILDPFYKIIRKNIASSFGVFDFTPIILLFGIALARGLVNFIFSNF